MVVIQRAQGTCEYRGNLIQGGRSCRHATHQVGMQPDESKTRCIIILIMKYRKDGLISNGLDSLLRHQEAQGCTETNYGLLTGSSSDRQRKTSG